MAIFRERYLGWLEGLPVVEAAVILDLGRKNGTAGSGSDVNAMQGRVGSGRGMRENFNRATDDGSNNVEAIEAGFRWR